jgi:hypothetical protein
MAIGAPARGQAIRSGLVVAEVALSVILLAGASLAIRSFAGLMSIYPGFQPQRVLRVQMPLLPKLYPSLQQRNNFAARLLDSVQRLPGVESAACDSRSWPLLPSIGFPPLESSPFYPSLPYWLLSCRPVVRPGSIR